MPNKDKVRLQMISEYQCTGCVYGPSVDSESNTQECEKFHLISPGQCANHTLGTMLGIGNYMALGMPTGFNKQQLPCTSFEERTKIGAKRSSMLDIFIYTSPEEFKSHMELNFLNVPVWYRHFYSDFFLRIFHPRIGSNSICIIRHGDKTLIPDQFKAFNVKDFEDQID